CTNVGANTTWLIVTDVNGNKDSADATVTVSDNIKPTVVTQNISVNLNGSGMASIIPGQIDNGSSDNCGIASMTVSKSDFDCTNSGPNTIYLIVTDDNGNVDSAASIVTIAGDINPTAVTKNISINLNGSGTATIAPAQVDNGSTSICGI